VAGRSSKATAKELGSVDADAVLATYAAWLKRQPLATRSRDAYLAQVRSFTSWLSGSEHGAEALTDPHVRDWAVRDTRWGPRRLPARRATQTPVFSC
jgi:hypothetical protein